MTEPRLYLSPPHMGSEERALLLEAFDSNWIAPLGPHVDAFEAELSAVLGGAHHVVALSSGTAALHLSLCLSGVGVGDRVLCSTLTFVATANAIRYLGAQPVFIDSEEQSWNLDAQLVRQALSRCETEGALPKAVIAVDLYGQCPDYAALRAVCDEFGVTLIEDAAEALGASFHGGKAAAPAGTFGHFGVFSFNGNKIITTSAGGALVTQSREQAERARYLASQARDPAPHYEHSELGYNYRMSNLLAAVGRGQLRALEERVAARRRVNAWYRERLAACAELHFQPEAPWGRSTFWLTCLSLGDGTPATRAHQGSRRDRILVACERANIEARPVWKPMHLQPLHRGSPVIGGAVSERLFETGLCLPSGSRLSETDVDRVCEVVGKALSCA